MKSRKIMMLINWLMVIALVVVFGSGIWLKVMPGMVMGITHALSSVVMVVCAVIHCIQHGMFHK